MKKIILSSLTVGLFLLSACSEQEVQYKLDNKATTMNWTGKYVADGHTHTGTIAVSKGEIKYKGEEFVSGEFTIDMKSINVTDLDPESKEKLEGHLSSPDFFDTKSHAEAKITITEISEKEITATISLLGKEVKAKMPLKITKDEKGFNAKGKFEVDFASLNAGGFKAQAGDPEIARTDSKIAFDLNLVLTK